jgi:hypothetical protein
LSGSCNSFSTDVPYKVQVCAYLGIASLIQGEAAGCAVCALKKKPLAVLFKFSQGNADVRAVCA